MCAWDILPGVSLNKLRYGKEKGSQGGEAKDIES